MMRTSEPPHSAKPSRKWANRYFIWLTQSEPRRRRSHPAAPENDAQIIGRHRHGLRQRQTVTPRQSRHVGEVAHAPSRVLPAQPGVELEVARRGMAAVDPVRAIEIENAAGRQHALGAGKKAFARRPRRDVDHVDADERVGARDRPFLRHHIERKRRQKVRGAGGRAVRGDARQHPRIDIGRLPGHTRQPLGKVGGMLAAAARYFEYKPLRRQHAAQHIEDRLAVTRHMRMIEPRIGGFRHPRLPAFPALRTRFEPLSASCRSRP